MVRILVLNLGSTSSKLAIYDGEKMTHKTNLVHDDSIIHLDLLKQKDARQLSIQQWLTEIEVPISSIDAIACRGGLLKPIVGGTYTVNRALYNDLKSFQYGVHASNLSAIIGFELGLSQHIPVFTTDPVVVDELIDEVRITGIPGVQRKSVFHALNHKATARQFANNIQKRYEDLNLIIIHMGGGVSVAAHQKGLVIDVNEALYGEGPMALNRSGSVPNDALIAYQNDHLMDTKQMKRLLSSQTGLQAHLGSSDFKWIMDQYTHDTHIQHIVDAFAIQIAKAIGERAAVLKGQVDQIVFTGGMSHSTLFIELLKPYIEWISPVSVYPGEFEMHALAENAFQALHKQIPVKTYS